MDLCRDKANNIKNFIIDKIQKKLTNFWPIFTILKAKNFFQENLALSRIALHQCCGSKEILIKKRLFKNNLLSSDCIRPLF